MAPTPAYCIPSDITSYAISPTALSTLTTPQLQFACDMANSEADTLGLRTRYALPLLAWGVDLRARCAQLAAFYAMTFLGFNPEDPRDKAVSDASKRARKWLGEVAGRTIHPDVTDSGNANLLPDDSVEPTRGWKEWGTGRTYAGTSAGPTVPTPGSSCDDSGDGEADV